MAFTKTGYIQGGTATEIGATDTVSFTGGAFGTPIVVGEYNDGTYVRSSGGTDQSTGNTPHNSKYLTGSTVSINGGESANLNSVTTANCPLRITLTNDTNITVADIEMFGFDGTTATNAPSGVTLYLAKQGDTNWTQAAGSSALIEYADSSTPATSHNFYGLMSLSPSSVGEKTAMGIRFSFTYQ